MKTALFWNNQCNTDGSADTVLCRLCPHGCHIPAGQRGLCGVRRNMEGVLYAESYGQLSALALDPIEKKPIYHLDPGGLVLSAGGYGCNFRCAFCQNHSISMAFSANQKAQPPINPEALVREAEACRPQGNIGLAYTYNEPFIAYEYMLDCAKLCRERGMKNIVVTNGYVNPEPLMAILPVLDALNIDLKSFHEAFYQKIGGHIAPVQTTIETASQHCLVEVTTLIIPKENDSPEEMDALASWLASVDRDIPLHLIPFRPMYKMSDKPPTTADTLRTLRQVAKAFLKYVY